MASEEKEEAPIKQQNMLLYAITNFGVFLLFSFPPTFLYYFFTDPVASGGLNFNVQEDAIRYLLIAIGLIIGIFAGPLFGYLSDRTRTRFGRRRIWMAIFGPLMAFSFVMLTIPFGREYFLTPESATFYLIIVYIIYSIFVNAFNTPYGGLMADITTPENRLEMSGMFNIFGALGTALGLFLPVIILSFTNSWVMVTLVYGLILLTTSFITLFTIKEPHAISDTWHKIKKIPFREILKNRKFVIFESAQFCWNLAFNLVLAALPAIADTVFGLGTATEFGMMAVILLLILGIFFFMYMRKGDQWGKQRTMTFALIYLAFVIPLGTFIYYTRLILPIPILIQGVIYISMIAVGLSAIFVFPIAILLDIIRKDQEASYMGVNAIFMNASGAVGTLIIFGVTATYAEDAFFIVAPILGFILLIAGAIFLIFPLYDKKSGMTGTQSQS
ncbi:MAG: MFS transporter [Candidatus Helarchaeota archaeon]|nr:MFS transporter [Candidatus Helarchaeota archaeon]